jgi:hypothetical protein
MPFESRLIDPHNPQVQLGMHQHILLSGTFLLCYELIFLTEVLLAMEMLPLLEHFLPLLTLLVQNWWRHLEKYLKGLQEFENVFLGIELLLMLGYPEDDSLMLLHIFFQWLL